MCVMKDLDRFHLVADVIDGVRGLERGRPPRRVQRAGSTEADNV
jgi:hypothetical protein